MNFFSSFKFINHLFKFTKNNFIYSLIYKIFVINYIFKDINTPHNAPHNHKVNQLDGIKHLILNVSNILN